MCAKTECVSQSDPVYRPVYVIMVWYIIDGVNIFVKMFIISQEHVQEEMVTSEDGQAKEDKSKEARKDKSKEARKQGSKEEIKDEDEETPGKGVSEEENIKIIPH